jgi:hypothetical protein
MKKFMLVLQFPDDQVDFDRLVELEDELGSAVEPEAEVDGHDFGSGEGNIFIHTDDPEGTFQVVKGTLEPAMLHVLKAAYRARKGETYRVLWPAGLDEFSVV